jgi:hypothetical protein
MWMPERRPRTALYGPRTRWTWSSDPRLNLDAVELGQRVVDCIDAANGWGPDR